MATRMKLWIGVVAVSIAAIAVWTLPPGYLGPTERPAPAAVEIRHGELDNEFRWTAERLRAVLWEDSLSELTVTAAQDGFTFGLPEYQFGTEGDLPARLAAKVRGELRSLPVRSDEVVVGYFLQPYSHAYEDGMPGGMRRRVDTYVGTRGGSNYCIQARVVGPNDVNGLLNEVEGTSRTSPTTNALGLCRIYAQYGLAGAQIQEWMDRGGAGFGGEIGEQPEIPEEYRRLVATRQLFGAGSLGFRSIPVEATQCHAGIVEACGYLLAHPDLESPMPTWQLRIALRTASNTLGRSGVNGLPLDAAYLLYDLETEFGHDAFRRFWTSERGFEGAFEDAFGVAPATWMTGWVDRVASVRPAGPGLPRTASSGGALAVALLVGLAFARNRKRSVV